MEQKKNKKLLIAIIIVTALIVIIIGGILLAYLTTDLFKSNKEMFFKYASQLMNQENGLLDSTLKQYYEKREATPYENEGTLKFQVNIPGEQETTKRVNDFQITFSGLIDVLNAKRQQDISLNYSKDVTFPISYRQIDNVVGLQTKYVGSKYIAIEEGNETVLTENSGLSSSGFSNSPNLSETINSLKDNLRLEENLQHIKENYLDITLQDLKESNFTKRTNSLGEEYQLSLSGSEMKTILIKWLEILKNDTDLLNKINQQGDNEIIGTANLEALQKSINEETSWDEEKLDIMISQQNKLVNKITFQIKEGKFEIEKIKSGNELQYLIVIQSADETVKMYLSAKYVGIQSEAVNESIEIGITYPKEENNTMYQLTAKEEKEMVQNLIADAKSSKLLNGQDSSTVTDEELEIALNSGENENYANMKLEKITDTSFKITYISSNHSYEFDNTGKITKEPEVQEDEAETEEENQIVQYQYNYENNIQFTGNVTVEKMTEDNSVILNKIDSESAQNLINAIKERITQVNQDQMEQLGISATQNPLFYIIPIPDLLGEKTLDIDAMNQQELETFNNKFKMYESTNTRGATVKGLLTVIQTNNEENSNHPITEINFDGEEYEVTEQNITLIKSNIGVEDAYKIEFEYDRDTGAIYRAIINKK